MKPSEQDRRPARLRRILKQLRPDEDAAEFLSLYDGYSADFAPAGPLEESLVTHLALLSLRIRNCVLMESDVLRRGMEATATGEDGHEMAVGRAFMHDFEDVNHLDKLSRYASLLQGSHSRTLKRLRRMQEMRKRRRPKSAGEIELELLEPCTSVVQ